MTQGSVEWYSARLGNLTGSRIYAACATRRNGGYYATREDMLIELLIERLTGEPVQHYVSDAMEWGIMHEADARSVYETRNGVIVQECAYFPHPEIEHSGATPDGLIGDDGVLEIKCPTTKTHLETILSDTIPEQYEYQMAWEIESTGRMYADYVSYDPRLPANLSYYCKRYTPTDDFRALLRDEVRKFLSVLAELEARVRAHGQMQ